MNEIEARFIRKDENVYLFRQYGLDDKQIIIKKLYDFFRSEFENVSVDFDFNYGGRYIVKAV